MSYTYAFPKLGFQPENVNEQLKKIDEEVLETMRESWLRDDFEMLVECFDVIHACETLLRLYPQSSVDDAYEECIRKNKERDYYG